MSKYIESYFDPHYRVAYRPDAEGRNMRAATAKVAEYDAEFKAAAERKAGRPLSQTEVLRGVTPREDRPHQQQYNDSRWKPKMAPVGGTVYDRLLAEADGKQLDTSLTPEGYKNRLRTGKRELDADADAEAAEREWLADPFRARALDELNALESSFRYDTSRTASEVEAIRKARVQLGTPGADTSEARRLLNAVFQHEAAREQTIRQSAEADIEAAKSRLANLKYGNRPAKVAAPAGANMKEKLHALFNAVNEAGGSSRDLEVISEARESGDVGRMEWALSEYSEQPSEQPTGVVVEETNNE